MTSSRDLLTAMVGEWEGNYQLWLEPEVLTAESATQGTIRPQLGGRFVVHTYAWTIDGEPQQGFALLGCTSEGVYQMAWTDTWHNGDAIMFCTGGPPASVLGSYGGPDERWGWRTDFAMPDADQLVITAWNISPAGDEVRATEARYRRVG